MSADAEASKEVDRLGERDSIDGREPETTDPALITDGSSEGASKTEGQANSEDDVVKEEAIVDPTDPTVVVHKDEGLEVCASSTSGSCHTEARRQARHYSHPR